MTKTKFKYSTSYIDVRVDVKLLYIIISSKEKLGTFFKKLTESTRKRKTKNFIIK